MGERWKYKEKREEGEEITELFEGKKRRAKITFFPTEEGTHGVRMFGVILKCSDRDPLCWGQLFLNDKEKRRKYRRIILRSCCPQSPDLQKL